MITSLFEAAGIALIFALFTAMVDPQQIERHAWMTRVAGSADPRDLLWVAGGLLIVLFTAKAATQLGYAWLRIRTGWKIQVRLSSELFRGYLNSPYSTFLGRNSSTLLRNVTSCVSDVSHSCIVGLVDLVGDSLLLIGIIAVLLYIEPEVSLIAMALLAVIAALYLGVGQKYFRRWGRLANEAAAAMYRAVSEPLAGIKQVKILHSEPFFAGDYRRRISTVAQMTRRNMFVMQSTKPVLELAIAVGLIGAIFVALERGFEAASVVPTLALFGMAAYRMMPLLLRIANTVQNIRFAEHALSIVYEDTMQFRANSDAAMRLRPSSRQEFRDGITLDSVSHRYDGAGDFALRDISMEIRRGESIGLVGTSGAGKTTLADIVLGLLHPTHEAVSIDGKRLDRDGAHRYLFGYVPQDTFLMDDTIRRNVALGTDDDAIDDTRIWQALADAALDDFVRSLPSQLDTIIGERGARMSGGQRQRLAIARTLYAEPEILVLDEATSSLDMRTEAEISRTMHNLHGKKTLIIIAHRLSTLKQCDRLFLLDHGRLIDSGSFAELVQRNAGFKDLALEMQLAE